MDPRQADQLLEQIRTEWHQRLVTFARGKLRVPDDADDVVQDAYIRLWFELATGDDRERIGRAAESIPRDPQPHVRFLFACVRGLCANRTRQGRRRARILNAADDERARVDPRQALADRIYSGEVLALLESEVALVLRRRFLHDLPFKAIAERLGISEGAARVRVWRARKRAREVLGVTRAKGM